jgi:hypothetical protein
LAVVVVLSLGCISVSPAAASQASVQTPQATIRAYYAALASHRWQSASNLLAPSLRKTFSDAPDGAVQNLVSVSDVHDLKGNPDPTDEHGVYAKLYAGYSDLWEFGVKVTFVYKKVITSYSGPTVRFIILGKRHGKGPWRILAIGTGP